jgi:hypothetical protein
MRSYNLDAKSASSAGVANYISETGKYIGTFTRAECVTSKQGTEGVEFSFTTNDGMRSDYLQLWTYNANGDALPSLKVLNAVMACLRIRTIAPAPITVTRFDGSTASAHGFPMLTGKPIGVLLQREEYEKSDGSTGYKFNFVAPFEAQTELTAGEILAQKTEPQQLERMVGMLKDKPMKSGGRQHRAPAHQSDGGVQAMDDDIPF